MRVVSACHSDGNRSQGAATALSAGSSLFPLLQWQECYRQKGKGQGSFVGYLLGSQGKEWQR